MKLLVVLVSLVLVVLIGGVPVFRQGEDLAYAYEVEDPLEEELLRERRSLPEFEEIPFEEELLRERRSLPEFEEIPFEDVEDHGMRAKRATCDALSFSSKWLTVNHSACAIHCLTKGYKGGKCVKTICNCRN